MSQANEPKKTALAQASGDAMVVDTTGRRVHVQWDETAQATPHGQVAFFAEALATAGVFDRRVQACLLHHSSPNVSRPRGVPGALMLGILAGSKRSALMSSVREALDRPWALDMDATIKPLHGRREGAQIGCNPHKPGRPSHLLHAFWVGNLSMVTVPPDGRSPLEAAVPGATSPG